MTTACITTTAANKTATELLSDTLEHAWAAVRGGYVMSDGMDHHFAHYDAAVWTACRALMDAGLALEAAVSEAAERLGVDMVVLEPLMGRAVPRKGGQQPTNELRPVLRDANSPIS